MLIVEDEIGIRLLRPVLRGYIDVVWESADSTRDSDVLRREKHELVFPIQTRRRHARAGQPVERDVVEYVISCKSLCPTVEDAGAREPPVEKKRDPIQRLLFLSREASRRLGTGKSRAVDFPRYGAGHIGM